MMLMEHSSDTATRRRCSERCRFVRWGGTGRHTLPADSFGESGRVWKL